VRVTKWIEIPGQEIEIEISGADAVEAMLEGSEEWTPEQLVLSACNNFLTTIQRLPDAAIAAQTPEVRKLVADVFEVQAKRFREVTV